MPIEPGRKDPEVYRVVKDPLLELWEIQGPGLNAKDDRYHFEKQSQAETIAWMMNIAWAEAVSHMTESVNATIKILIGQTRKEATKG